MISILKAIAEDTPKAGNASIAAAIVYKNRVISIGVNQLKTHPFQLKYSKNPESIYLHAETSAIYNASKRINPEQLSKCSLFILRVKSDGSFGCAKPCVGCQKCIVTFGIKDVYYTDVGDEFCKL